jgi:hypothetical protein
MSRHPGLRKTYGDWAAHAQRLPHEQLRAGPHEHLLGGAHHHHARRLHGQDPGGFEHGGCLSWVGRVEWRVSSVGELVVSSQERWGSSLWQGRYGPEKAESLIGCGGQCAERVRPSLASPTSLRHDLLPPAIAATPAPNTIHAEPQSCPTTRTTTAVRRWSPSPSSSSLVSFSRASPSDMNDQLTPHATAGTPCPKPQ